MGDVVRFNGITRHDLPADAVRDEVPDDMQEIIVIGLDADGEFYFASNKADGGSVRWLMELAKLRLLDAANEVT